MRPLRPEEKRGKNESPYPQADTWDERTVTRTHAGQGDGTTSVLPSAKPSITYSSPSASKPSTAYPPSAKPSTPYPPAPALAKTVSSQMNMPEGALPSDPQAPSRATFKSPHPPSANRGLARPRADEPGRTASLHPESHRPSATLEYTPATTESPQHGHTEGLPPIYMEHIPTATERPSRQDCKDPSSASRRPPVPLTGYVPDGTQYQKHPPKDPFNGRTHLIVAMVMIRAPLISLTRATLERLDSLCTQRHLRIEGNPPSQLLLRWYILKISPKISSEKLR